MKKDTKKNIWLVLLSILLSITGTEGILRSIGTFQTWSEKTGKDYRTPYLSWTTEPWLVTRRAHTTVLDKSSEFVFEINANGEGLRDIEHEVFKREDLYRIILLGDSFAEGLGASFNQTAGALLQEIYNNKKCNKQVEFILGGVAGSDPVLSYNLLNLKLLKYRPDVVIMLTNNTDQDDLVGRGSFGRFDKSGSVNSLNMAPWWEPFFKYSHIIRAIMLRVLNYDWFLLKPEKHTEKSLEALSDLENIFVEIKKLADQNNFDFLVVSHPMSWQFKENAGPSPIETLETNLMRRGVQFISLSPFFKNHINVANVNNYYWPIDGHFKQSGYLLLAACLEQVLSTHMHGLFCSDP